MTTDAFNSCEKVIQELKRQKKLGFLCEKEHLNEWKGIVNLTCVWISSLIDSLVSFFFFTAKSSTKGLMVIPWTLKEKNDISTLNMGFRQLSFQSITSSTNKTIKEWHNKHIHGV